MHQLNSITVYRDWVEVAERLPSDADRGQFYHSIALYSLYGMEPNLSEDMKLFFNLIRPQLDKSQKCRIAQQKGAENRRSRAHQDQPPPPELEPTDLIPPPQPVRKNGKTYAFMLPEQLKSDRCVEKWNQWEDYRRQKHKPISTAAAIQQMENVKSWDEDTFIAAVEFSIANDYQALVAQKNKNQHTQQTKQKDNTGI